MRLLSWKLVRCIMVINIVTEHRHSLFYGRLSSCCTSTQSKSWCPTKHLQGLGLQLEISCLKTIGYLSFAFNRSCAFVNNKKRKCNDIKPPKFFCLDIISLRYLCIIKIE